MVQLRTARTVKHEPERHVPCADTSFGEVRRSHRTASARIGRPETWGVPPTNPPSRQDPSIEREREMIKKEK